MAIATRPRWYSGSEDGTDVHASAECPNITDSVMCLNSICPGRFFADKLLWMTIANVLALFDILPPLHPVTGDAVMPEENFTSGATTCVSLLCVRVSLLTRSRLQPSEAI